MTTTLVMLSGELDSTAALKHVLVETTDAVHVHHIHYKNDRDRWQAEAHASEKIIRHLRQCYRSFAYSETTQDYRKLGVFMDVPMLAFTAAMVCRVHPEIDRVTTGLLRADRAFLTGWAYPDKGPPVRIETMHAVFRAASDGDPKQRQFWWPLLGWSKTDAMRYLGAELYGLTWSCRMPVWWKSVPSRCRTCVTCREIDQAEESLRKRP